MKRSSFTLLLITAFFSLSAQRPDLFAKRSDNTVYLEHKVAAKESFFSVGRLYNVHPRYLASYNKMDYNKGLFLDKTIRIPLTDTNFSQNANTGTPVYYRATEKDNWNSISKAFKVPVEKLRSWNDADVKKGDKIVIGLLQSPEMIAKTFAPNKGADITKDERKADKEAVKEEKKELEAAEKTATKEKEVIEEKKEEVVPAVDKKIVETAKYDQGYFKTSFEQQVMRNPARKDETLTSGIFKTASGWQDAKYYLLMDGVSPGTIVRIINPSNNRVIYAKVLGEMSGIRLNDGLNIRISNAAAAALEITDTDKFIVKVNH